ncbi:MAG: hypothetical protein L0229_01865 [Blastocatellia bacterium]|nr:hypothetical protein [Blastocatellia bacterium]
MKTNPKNLRLNLKVGVIALAMLVLVTSGLLPISLPLGQVRAFDNLSFAPPFDFSNDFLLKNGVDPTKIPNRPRFPDEPFFLADRNPSHFIVDPSNTDPSRRGIRILETTGGWDKDGNLIYYSVMGDMVPATFTDDAAGVRARMMAEDFKAFLFPKTPRNPDGSPGDVLLSPAPPNRRQDNVFETRDAYFCQNLLGLWIVTMVVYTKDGFNAWTTNTNPAAKAILQEIADRNGTDLDGTPILNTLHDIENLRSLGLVEFRFNAEGGPPAGEDGPRWVI